MRFHRNRTCTFESAAWLRFPIPSLSRFFKCLKCNSFQGLFLLAIYYPVMTLYRVDRDQRRFIDEVGKLVILWICLELFRWNVCEKLRLVFTSRFIRIPFVMQTVCSTTFRSGVKSECNIFHGGTVRNAELGFFFSKGRILFLALNALPPAWARLNTVLTRNVNGWEKLLNRVRMFAERGTKFLFNSNRSVD